MDKRLDNENANICEELNEDIFMAIFRKGAYEYLEDGINEFKDVPNFSLPETGEKKILNLINKQVRKEKANRILKKLVKIAAIFFIIVTVCTITIISVEALRVPVYNFFINSKDEITNVQVNETTSEAQNNSSFEPSYLPEGFELASTNEDGDFFSQFYMNNNEDTIIINQNSSEGFFGIDTENAEYDSIKINNSNGFYSEKNGTTQLYFYTEYHSYLIISTLDITELVKIANSIQ